MAFIRWDKSLSVKLKEIDNQHENLFRIINNLHGNLRIGKGDNFLKPILNTLVEDVIIHFKTEEKFMKKYNYPKLEQHKKEHKAYISEIKELISKDRNRTPLLARNILLSLGNWYRKHIHEYDKKFGNFVEEKNIELNNK